MLITGNITLSMMEDSNMTRGTQLGIPKDPFNPSLGLIWKNMFDLDDSDFDSIEQYFKNKGNKTGPDGHKSI